MTWIKFSDKIPPETKNKKEAKIPVLVGINSELDGLMFDLIYWQMWGKNWHIGIKESYIHNDLGYDLKDLSWLSFSLPELETEEEV